MFTVAAQREDQATVEKKRAEARRESVFIRSMLTQLYRGSKATSRSGILAAPYSFTRPRICLVAERRRFCSRSFRFVARERLAR